VPGTFIFLERSSIHLHASVKLSLVLVRNFVVFGSELGGVRPSCLHVPVNYVYFNLPPLILRLTESLLLVTLAVAHGGIRNLMYPDLKL